MQLSPTHLLCAFIIIMLWDQQYILYIVLCNCFKPVKRRKEKMYAIIQFSITTYIISFIGGGVFFDAPAQIFPLIFIF